MAYPTFRITASPLKTTGSRFTALFIFVLLGFCVPHPVSAAPKTEQEQRVDAVHEKLLSTETDLLDMVLGLSGSGLDQDIAHDLINTSAKHSGDLLHIRTLLQINSLVQNDADKQRIQPIIARDIKSVAGGIKRSVTSVNTNLARIKSPALVTKANKLRDILREIEELISTP